MLKLSFSILTILLALPLLLSAQSITTNGLHFEARLVLDKDTMILGETGFFRLEIENLSDTTIYVPLGGDYRNKYGRPDSYNIEVISSDGVDVSTPPVQIGFGGLIGSRAIPAKGVFVERLFLPHWGIFEKPETYTITLQRTFRGEDKSTDEPRYTLPVKTTAKLTVLAADDLKMGKLIDSLSQSMLLAEPKLYPLESPSMASARILAQINDPRVISHLETAMLRFGDQEESSLQNNIAVVACAGIEKYDQDEALNALEKVMNFKSDRLRTCVAEVLGESKNSRAAGMLALMRDDKYYIVRIRVAHGLGVKFTEKIIPHLKKLARDENESVRETAERVLELNNVKN